MNRHQLRSSLKKAKYMKGRPLTKSEMWEVIQGNRFMENLSNIGNITPEVKYGIK